MAKNYKLIVWLGAVALLAIRLWSYHDGVSFNSITGIDFGPGMVITFLVLTSWLTLGFMAFQSRRWSLVAAVIVALLFLSAVGFSYLNFIGALIFIFFVFYAASLVIKEMRERMTLDVAHILRVGLLTLVIGFFVLVSFAAYQSPLSEQIKKSQTLPNQMQTFFRQIVDKTFGSKIQAPTESQRQQLLNEIASQTFQEFNSLLKPYFKYAPPVLAFGLFLILWGLSFIFAWLGMLVGMVIYWVLKKTGMVRIEVKKVDAEVLVV